ncbi:hypothetical protein RUMHYD_03854 [Blautia hydrogenotrophica DSM 10507]|uniref:Uncharacterized protein n=1 Tax=Blautia hydrogenotrophica (strain DSM 10507 / JCM 14656 / S5a33) TaxID=476272 RepID=C0CSI7_BLAHS|nr:hypothetical protein RUMHYD_03854 [Blautia hydrogenotrophica DSM 10507]
MQFEEKHFIIKETTIWGMKEPVLLCCRQNLVAWMCKSFLL